MITELDQDFSQLSAFVAQRAPSQLIILTDENTHEHCLPILLGNLETNIPFEIIEIEAGEEMKTLETAAQLWEILTEFKTDRNALLINLGGGVITDLGGFVASVYKRGIPFINIPTSLLGMCDASVGGKTGIDHLFLKNIIGTFASAEEVFLYPEFLKTLPFEELRSGFAEMLKHGLIADAAHWAELAALPQLIPEALFPLLKKSVQIKQTIVAKDFQERNIRKTLNFGHTIGHAVESAFLQAGRPILHGEAVALGMICEAVLSVRECGLHSDDVFNISDVIRKHFPLLPLAELDENHLLALMQNDKKNSEGQVKFALLDSVGSATYDCKVSAENIRYALHYYRQL